jgi:hypothetical protein
MREGRTCWQQKILPLCFQEVSAIEQINNLLITANGTNSLNSNDFNLCLKAFYFLSDDGSIEVKEGVLSNHNCENLKQSINKVQINLLVSNFSLFVYNTAGNYLYCTSNRK